MSKIEEFAASLNAFAKTIAHDDPTAESVNAARDQAWKFVSTRETALKGELSGDHAVIEADGFGAGPLPEPYSDDDLVIDTPEIYLHSLQFWVEQTARDWFVKLRHL